MNGMAVMLTDEQRKKIAAVVPDEAEALLNADDVNDIIRSLDARVVSLFDADDEPTGESREVERLLDAIYIANTKDE